MRNNYQAHHLSWIMRPKRKVLIIYILCNKCKIKIWNLEEYIVND